MTATVVSRNFTTIHQCLNKPHGVPCDWTRPLNHAVRLKGTTTNQPINSSER